MTSRMLFVYYVFSLILAGCAFSEKSGDPKITDASELSANQEKFLIATENNDIPGLEILAAKMSAEELSFSKSKKTPLSLALQLNLPSVLKTFSNLKIDFNSLGEQEDVLLAKGFAIHPKNFVKEIDTAQISPPSLNDAEKGLLEKFNQDSINIIDQLKNEGPGNTKSTMRFEKINCKFTIQNLLMKRSTLSYQDQVNLVSFLDMLECQISPRFLRSIYKNELLQQFRTHFQHPAILAYFFKIPNLDLMWDLDDSGVMISPQLLLRIAYDEPNRDLLPAELKGRCDDMTNTENHPLCKGQVYESNTLLKSLGYITPPYELIDARAKLYLATHPVYTVSRYDEALYLKIKKYLNLKNANRPADFWTSNVEQEELDTRVQEQQERLERRIKEYQDRMAKCKLPSTDECSLQIERELNEIETSEREQGIYDTWN